MKSIQSIVEEFRRIFPPKDFIDTGAWYATGEWLRKELEARDRDVANDVVDFIIAHSVQDRAMPHMKLVNEKVLHTARSLHPHEEKECCDACVQYALHPSHPSVSYGKQPEKYRTPWCRNSSCKCHNKA